MTISQVKEWNGKQLCLSNYTTETLVFPGIKLPQWTDDTAPIGRLEYTKFPKHATQPTLEEQKYVMWLKQWSRDKDEFTSQNVPMVQQSAALESTRSPPQAQPGSRKFALLKDVSDSLFCDVVAEVIKVHNGMMKEVYITDYTSNSKFYKYPEPGDQQDDQYGYQPGDEYGYLANTSANHQWKGPYGQHVLAVTLFPPHAGVELRERDFVHIRNMRVTYGRSGSAHLEGKLHQDRKFLDRIDIMKLSSEKVRSNKDLANKLDDFRLRKDAYWKALYQRKPALRAPIDQPKELSKAKKKAKKRKKAEAEAEAKLQEQTHEAGDDKLQEKNVNGMQFDSVSFCVKS